ncbi:MAG: hypothetical protein WA941_08110 [Nitrososphaeraceae archaeon]
MSIIRTNDANPYIKFILDNQEAFKRVLAGLVDIAAFWMKIQIENYFADLSTRSRFYRTQ